MSQTSQTQQDASKVLRDYLAAVGVFLDLVVLLGGKQEWSIRCGYTGYPKSQHSIAPQDSLRTAFCLCFLGRWDAQSPNMVARELLPCRFCDTMVWYVRS